MPREMYRNQNQSRNNMTLCSKCNGNTWIFTESDEQGRTFVKRCPVCQDSHIRAVSGVPPKYAECYYNAFPWDNYTDVQEYTKNIVNGFYEDYIKAWKENNTGLYIFANTRGCGKTFLSSSLINSINTRYKESALFISSVDYFQTLKSNMSTDADRQTDTTKYFETDLLCIDDLGAEKTSDWTNNEMFRLLDYRYLHGKVTIITSNYDIDELPCDMRIKDRIYDMCFLLHLPEEAIRRNAAVNRKKDFIKKYGYMS